MTLNRSVIGREVRLEPVTVDREAVIPFARALWFSDGIHTDVDHARRAGHPDVVAPPTFVVALSAPAAHAVLDDPELGLDYTRVVHGEQAIELVADIHAGDTLVLTTRLIDIRVAGRHELVVTETKLARPDGRVPCTLRSVTVSRGTAAGSPS
jgi:acyl dehydratase